MSHFNSNACDRSFASICSEKLRLEDWKQESKETEMARVWVFLTVLHLVRNLTLQFTTLTARTADGNLKNLSSVSVLWVSSYVPGYRDLDTSLLLKRCSSERVIWLGSPDLDREPGRKFSHMNNSARARFPGENIFPTTYVTD